MQKIKVGDTVILLAGKDKGRSGRVLNKGKKDRLFVEGVNLVKKHVRGNPQQNVQGGIIEREASIHVSNLGILNPQSNRSDRVGFKVLEDGKKVRCFKSNGEVIDVE
ncbi:MAG: 50S ribosomal protein L24 [Coxiella sp. (in: Bacteria)]|nr:MAG: 50S ribosomal protein L24 [Coxiella sp. (in: g-proteobacteria)]